MHKHRALADLQHLEEDATLLHLVERRDCDALQYFCPTFIWEVALG